MSDKTAVDHLRKFVGKTKGARDCPNNPWFTVAEIIVIANYMDKLELEVELLRAGSKVAQ